MRQTTDPAIGSQPHAISDAAYRRLWGAVVEQVISDACRPLPSGTVADDERYEDARDRAAVTLEARAMILDPARCNEIQDLCDYAGIEAIPACIKTRIRIAAEADKARPERVGWRLIGENMAIFNDRMGRAASKKAVLAA